MKENNQKELKDIQLGILKKIADYYKSNNISYYLAYGLLEAIRHNDYIHRDGEINIEITYPYAVGICDTVEGGNKMVDIKIFKYSTKHKFEGRSCNIPKEYTKFQNRKRGFYLHNSAFEENITPHIIIA